MNTETNKEVFVTGLTTDAEEPVNLEEIETTIANSLEEADYRPRNRAERRKMAKKLGKRGRKDLGTISETAKKLNYIELIEKLRELNEKKENENYEAAEDGNTSI